MLPRGLLLLENEVCVFSHGQVIHCEFPPCSIVYSASYLLWVQEREFIWQSGILKADLTRAEWARSHAALLIRNNAIHNSFCYRRFSILRINKCWQEYFDCEISYLLKFCMRSSILWVYLVVKTVRTHGWLCKQSSIFDSEFFCI